MSVTSSPKVESISGKAASIDSYELLMNSPMGIYTSSPEGRFLSANQAVAQMFGYSSPRELIDSITDMATQIYADPADREKFNSLLESQDEVVNYECLFKRLDGTEFWVSRNARVVRDQNGAISHYQGFIKDITKRKRVEEALKESRELLDTTQKLARVGGWEWDITHQKMIWTNETYRIYGLNPERIPNGSPELARFSLACCDPKDRDVIRTAFERCASEGEPYHLELPLSTADGKRIWIQTMARPVMKKGRIVKVRGNVMDITVRKRVDDELRSSLAEKETLLREVHHRVRNNLAIISALLDMQRQAVKDPATSDVLMDLYSRVKSIVLVHEILYNSKNMARIDFQDYLITLLHDLQFSLGAGSDIRCISRAQGIKIEMDIAIPCGMIISELATNAIKYAFPGGKTHDGTPPELIVAVNMEKGRYRIVVEDNGVGFPEDVDLQTSQSFGLRLARMIGIHQLQGKFELDHSNGTRITFSFKKQPRKHQ